MSFKTISSLISIELSIIAICLSYVFRDITKLEHRIIRVERLGELQQSTLSQMPRLSDPVPIQDERYFGVFGTNGVTTMELNIPDKMRSLNEHN